MVGAKNECMMNKQMAFKLLKLFHADIISHVYLIWLSCLLNSVFPPGASSPGDVAFILTKRGDGFEIGDAGIMHTWSGLYRSLCPSSRKCQITVTESAQPPSTDVNHQDDQATTSKAQNKSQSLFPSLVNTLPLLRTDWGGSSILWGAVKQLC